MTAIGVILCVASVIPLVATSVIGAEGYLIVMMVTLLLAMVAVGVNLLVRAGNRAGAYQKLLQEGDYTIRAKERNEKYGGLFTAFWLFAVGVYLGWSFISDKWQYTWIVWPIAVGIFVFLKMIFTKKD